MLPNPYIPQPPTSGALAQDRIVLAAVLETSTCVTCKYSPFLAASALLRLLLFIRHGGTSDAAGDRRTYGNVGAAKGQLKNDGEEYMVCAQFISSTIIVTFWYLAVVVALPSLIVGA